MSVIFLADDFSVTAPPATNFIYKNTVSDTTDKTVGQTWTFSTNDVGTEHAKRLVILGVHASTNPSGITVGGVSATRISSGSFGFTIWAVAFPTGSTADFVATAAGSTSRIVISYGIAYPNSPTRLGTGANSAGTTTDIVESISNTVMEIGGFLVAFGGAGATLGTSTWTWAGTDTLTEDSDAQLESTATYSFAHVNLTEAVTRNLTYHLSASGNKQMAWATWGAA